MSTPSQFPTFKEWAEDAAPEAPHLMRVSHATHQVTTREDIPPNIMDIIQHHARNTLDEFTRGVTNANVSPTWFRYWTYRTLWKFDTSDTDEALEIIVWGYTSDTDHTDHIEDLDGGSVWHVIESELYEVINRYAREALLSLTKDYAVARAEWEAEQRDDEPPYNPRNDPWSPDYDDGIPRGLTPEALAEYVAREEAQHLPYRP